MMINQHYSIGTVLYQKPKWVKHSNRAYSKVEYYAAIIINY